MPRRDQLLTVKVKISAGIDEDEEDSDITLSKGAALVVDLLRMLKQGATMLPNQIHVYVRDDYHIVV